jgi:hypothetical protein
MSAVKVTPRLGYAGRASRLPNGRGVIEPVQLPVDDAILGLSPPSPWVPPLAYVASGYTLRRSVEFRRALQVVQELGYLLSYRWWENEESTTEKAMEDLVGVMRADILVVVMPYANFIYRGTWVEIGAALALNKPVYIVGDVPDSQCIFFLLPNVHRGYPPEVTR